MPQLKALKSLNNVNLKPLSKNANATCNLATELIEIPETHILFLGVHNWF